MQRSGGPESVAMDGGAPPSEGCLAALSQHANDAAAYAGSMSLPPTLGEGVERSRAWMEDTVAPAVQSGLIYTREVAIPAAVTFANERALPYAQNVLLPALRDGYAYARDVALPVVLRAFGPAAEAAAPSAGTPGAASDDSRTVTPQHGVPNTAGHDEALPHAGAPAGDASGREYSSISNVCAATVKPSADQKAPLLSEGAPAGPHDIDKLPTELR
jgi:hypothetical protein